MARCIRNGVTFKRHKFVNNACKFCGLPEDYWARMKERALAETPETLPAPEHDGTIETHAAEMEAHLEDVVNVG